MGRGQVLLSNEEASERRGSHQSSVGPQHESWTGLDNFQPKHFLKDSFKMWPTYKQTKKYTFPPLCDVNSEKKKNFAFGS